jgi:hypothetical protein
MEKGYARAVVASEFDEDWNWYLSANNINRFYFISDVVVIHAILNLIGKADLIAAQRQMHKRAKPCVWSDLRPGSSTLRASCEKAAFRSWHSKPRVDHPDTDRPDGDPSLPTAIRRGVRETTVAPIKSGYEVNRALPRWEHEVIASVQRNGTPVRQTAAVGAMLGA